MAKGRKLTTSRSELLLGSYGHAVNTIQTDGEELREDDVWSMLNHDWNTHASMGSRYHNPVPPGDGATAVGGLSSAFADGPAGRMVSSPRIVHHFPSGASPRVHHMATSAPMNVPDWSRIYRVDSVESMHDPVDNQESGMVPPHEYLARAYAQNHNSAANSVFVGAGRTLKGRDLSRVRDAVWSQTGFNG